MHVLLAASASNSESYDPGVNPGVNLGATVTIAMVTLIALELRM